MSAAHEFVSDGQPISDPGKRLLDTSAGRIGAGLIAAGVLAESVLPYIRWRFDQTRVEPHDPTNAIQPVYDPDKRFLVATGLGRKGGHWREEGRSFIDDLGPVHPSHGLDSLTLSNWGVTENSIGEALASYYEEYYPDANQPDGRRQNIAAHSMGLVTTFMGMRWCLQNGVTVPRLGNIETTGSPLSIENTYKRDLAVNIARWPLRGGILSKIAIEAVQSKKRGMGRATESLAKTFQTGSPMLWASMVRMLIKARGAFDEPLFEGVIDTQTQFDCYVSSNDDTVKVDDAVGDIKDTLVSPYGASLNVHNLGPAGHANAYDINTHTCNWQTKNNPASLADGIIASEANVCFGLSTARLAQ